MTRTVGQGSGGVPHTERLGPADARKEAVRRPATAAGTTARVCIALTAFPSRSTTRIRLGCVSTQGGLPAGNVQAAIAAGPRAPDGPRDPGVRVLPPARSGVQSGATERSPSESAARRPHAERRRRGMNRTPAARTLGPAGGLARPARPEQAA